MIRIFLPLICAALGFAAASCSPSGSPFSPAEAPASTQSPPQQDSQGAAAAAMPSSPQSPPESQSAAEPQPDATTTTPVDRRASTLIGMPVVSTDGSAIGEVKDIIFDRQGRATHLVIAYGSQSDASADTSATAAPADAPADTSNGKPASNTDVRKLTAMPWDAAVASMKDGRLVLDGSKLQDAPSFTADTWPDLDNPAWSVSTDTYWRKAVQAAIAAHPGAPIDSTDRQRGRRARVNSGTGP